MSKSVYELALHESCFAAGFQVTRVPGGWLYAIGIPPTVIFVPLDLSDKPTGNLRRGTR